MTNILTFFPKVKSCIIVPSQLWCHFLDPEGVQEFLSPPVRMHGGLLCIAFCMSGWMDGCMWPNQNSYLGDGLTYGPQIKSGHGHRDPWGRPWKSRSRVKVTRSKKRDFRSHFTWKDLTYCPQICSGHGHGWPQFHDLMQPTFSLHSMYTAVTLQFKLGPNKGRWAHFNVKLHFW